MADVAPATSPTAVKKTTIGTRPSIVTFDTDTGILPDINPPQASSSLSEAPHLARWRSHAHKPTNPTAAASQASAVLLVTLAIVGRSVRNLLACLIDVENDWVDEEGDGDAELGDRE